MKKLYLLLFVISICKLHVASAFESKDSEGATIVVYSVNQDFKALSKSKVKMLFKGKVKRLNNKKFKLADWDESSQVRIAFYQAVLGKSVSEMNGYWASRIFSGKGKPPTEIKNSTSNDINQWVEKTPNGISYALLGDAPENANILFTIKLDTNL